MPTHESTLEAIGAVREYGEALNHNALSKTEEAAAAERVGQRMLRLRAARKRAGAVGLQPRGQRRDERAVPLGDVERWQLCDRRDTRERDARGGQHRRFELLAADHPASPAGGDELHALRLGEGLLRAPWRQ